MLVVTAHHAWTGADVYTVYDGVYHQGILRITPPEYTIPGDTFFRANNDITGGVISTAVYGGQRTLLIAPWLIMARLIVLDKLYRND